MGGPGSGRKKGSKSTTTTVRRDPKTGIETAGSIVDRILLNKSRHSPDKSTRKQTKKVLKKRMGSSGGKVRIGKF